MRNPQETKWKSRIERGIGLNQIWMIPNPTGVCMGRTSTFFQQAVMMGTVMMRMMMIHTPSCYSSSSLICPSPSISQRPCSSQMLFVLTMSVCVCVYLFICLVAVCVLSSFRKAPSLLKHTHTHTCEGQISNSNSPETDERALSATSVSMTTAP